MLYLHDGQNLFDPELAFKKGEHWRVGETATALIEAGRIPPLMIVGIANTGARRLHEYTPTHDRRRGGGDADDYGRLIIDGAEAVHRQPLSNAAGCAQALASAARHSAALVSLYLGLKHPDVFSRARRDVAVGVVGSPRRFFATCATRGPSRACGSGWTSARAKAAITSTTRRLLKVGLRKQGWVEGDDLHYEEIAGGTHSEGAWAERFGRVLEFLYS